MFRKKKSEACRENWSFCSLKCSTINRNKDRSYRYTIDGYKSCEFCSKLFAYKKSLKVRSTITVKFGRVAPTKQKFCSRKCSTKYKNKFFNPAKTESAKIKNSLSKLGKPGYKKTVEQRRRMSERYKGDKSHFWQGGKTEVNKLARNSVDYAFWREEVFKRDNWTCKICGIRSKKGTKVILQADHIKSFAYYPGLRYELSNGRTLCLPCHRKTDNYMGRAKNDIITT